MDFYDQLLIEKKRRGLNNKDVGAIIGKTGDALRVAMKRRSLSELEIKEIKKYFKLDHLSENGNEVKEAKQGGPQTIQELVAIAVMNKLAPVINKVLESHQKIIKELSEQSVDIDELKDEVSDLKEMVLKTHAAITERD